VSATGLNQEHINWCSALWNGMNEGAEWIVPRSMSKLVKREGKLYFRGTDDNEFAGMHLHFAAIGIEVVRVELGPNDLAIEPVRVQITDKEGEVR